MTKKKYGGYKNLHQDKTGLLKHREWRGFKDTFVDYWRWLVTWKDMIVMVLKNPVAVAKGLWRYRWMATYLSTPAFVDRHTEGLRGPQLLMTHLHFNMIVKHATGLILTAFEADEKMYPKNKKSKKLVCIDELIPVEHGGPTRRAAVSRRHRKFRSAGGRVHLAGGGSGRLR